MKTKPERYLFKVRRDDLAQIVSLARKVRQGAYLHSHWEMREGKELEMTHLRPIVSPAVCECTLHPHSFLDIDLPADSFLSHQDVLEVIEEELISRVADELVEDEPCIDEWEQQLRYQQLIREVSVGIDVV